MERSCGFLSFDGRVHRVDSAEDAAFSGAAAAEDVLARRSAAEDVLARREARAIAVRAQRAHTDSELPRRAC